MASTQGDMPALESGMPSIMSSGLFGSSTSPIGITRRAFSYDENLDAPLHSPPSDLSVNIIWKEPLIPRRKFNKIVEEEETGGKPMTLEATAAAKPTVPVVKAKATFLMSSLMTKQTNDSLQKFEHQAGLTDAVYSPHKGLSAEETRFHRLADGTQPKLRMPSGDFKEDRLTTSAQSTPCGTPANTPSVTPCVTPCVTPSVTPCVSPHASPSVTRRSWFNLSQAAFFTNPEPSSANTTSSDMGGTEGGGGGGEKWSLFGTRSVVQKSPTDPGSESSPGFTLQSYFSLQKSTTLEGLKSQVNLKVDDPSFLPPKIEISGAETKRAHARPHKLKPRDMNVLTPSGF